MPLVYDDSIDNVQNQPGTVLAVTASSTSSVYVTGSVLVSQSNIPAGSYPSTQAGAWSNLVSGTIGATQSGAFTVQVSGAAASGAVGGVNPIVVAGVDSGNIVRNLSVTSGGVQFVTSTLGLPVWVTGTVTTAGGGGGAVTQGGAWATLVSGTVGVSQSAGWTVQVSSTTAAPVYVATTGNLLVNTGTFPTVTVNAHAVTQGGAWGSAISGVLGAVAVTVTSTVAAPAYVAFTGTLPTGTFPVVTVTFTGALPGTTTVSQSNTQLVSQFSAWATLVSGTVGASQSAGWASLVSGTVGASQSAGWTVQVSSTTGAPVYVATTGALFVSQSNTPAGTQVVIITSSVTPTVTTVPLSLTGVALKAANTSRRGLAIYNQTTQVLYVAMGTTASLTAFTLIMDISGYYEAPYGYNGAYWGLHPAAGTGLVYVTEVT